MPSVHFIKPNGEKIIVDAQEGESILEVAHRLNLPLEGACEGSLSCSTCHVIISSEWYERLPEASPQEEDMLDLAFGLTKTSRLGCQIIMTSDLDGLEVTLPQNSRNLSFTDPL